MNNSESGPGFELPAMPTEQNETNANSHEVAPSRPETFRTPNRPTPTQSVSSVQSQPLVPALDSSQTNPSGSSQDMPSIADDNDLIEKEWVIKAKQIVAATKSDPYKQNFEMSKMKADYLKKRYNKDIKIEES